MTSRIVIYSAVLLASQLNGIAVAQPFSVTVPGISLADNSFSNVPIFMPGGLEGIEVLELELEGLSHERPGDIDMFLVSPFGAVAKIMTDRGGAIAVSSLTLTFADDADGVPTPQGPLESGRYRPGGLHEGSDGGLGSLGYSISAHDPWQLIIIDDAAGGAGSFESITIRGVGVPAAVPATGEWGLVVLTLAGLVAGTMLFRHSCALPV